MKVSGSFIRSKPSQCPLNLQQLSRQQQRKERKNGKIVKQTQQPTSQGNIPKKVHNSKAKRGNVNVQQIQKEKQCNSYDFEAFEAIVSSELYQRLNYQYRVMKTQMQEISQSLKKQIVAMNKEICTQEIRLTGLVNLKNSLIHEVNYLVEMESEIKLKNYEMKCDLLAEGNQGIPNYYESQQQIGQDSELGYEQMLELRQQLGVVPVGYDDKTIKKMKGKLYEANPEEAEEKCCICFDELQQGTKVYRTKCGHIHHLECLGRWLKIKRECPLCRCQIVLS